jgi:phosphoribosyl-ATP pyrophosphohydrolase
MAKKSDFAFLDELLAVINERSGDDPKSSYTAKLLGKGTEKIAQKLGEEAVELAIAAVKGKRAQSVTESADLLYHLLVLWADAGIAPAEIADELKKRRSQSGLAEKAGRRDG